LPAKVLLGNRYGVGGRFGHRVRIKLIPTRGGVFIPRKGELIKLQPKAVYCSKKNEWGTMGRKTEGILMITLKVLMGN
jgi:hypothetical protein